MNKRMNVIMHKTNALKNELKFLLQRKWYVWDEIWRKGQKGVWNSFFRFPILLKGDRESFICFFVCPLNWLQKIKFNFILIILRSTFSILKRRFYLSFNSSLAQSVVSDISYTLFSSTLCFYLSFAPLHHTLIFLYLNITYVYAPCSIGWDSKSAPLWSSALAPINTSDPSNAPPFHKWQENNFFISEK